MNGAEALCFLDEAPFREILIGRLKELEDNELIPNPRGQLAEEIGLSERTTYRIISGKQALISFDHADKIVTRILGPMAWYEDETLNAIYGSIDLTLLDWSFPVSEAVRSDLRAVAARFVKELGTSARAAEALGVSVGTIGRYAREARA